LLETTIKNKTLEKIEENLINILEECKSTKFLNYIEKYNLNPVTEVEWFKCYITYSRTSKNNIPELAHKEEIKKACDKSDLKNILYDSSSQKNIFARGNKLSGSRKNGHSNRNDGLIKFPQKVLINGFSCDTAAIYQKYTTGTGGTQNNAFKDLESFINDCPKIHRGEYLGVICTDGNYYTNKKIEKLKELAINKNCLITTTDEFCAIIRKLNA
jgi:hypothetical protein